MKKPVKTDTEIRRKSRRIRHRVGEILTDFEKQVEALRPAGQKRSPAKVYHYKGPAYLRPCGRGLCIYSPGTHEPYPSLNKLIGAALGIDSGDFEIEITARRIHPWRGKRKHAPQG